LHMPIKTVLVKANPLVEATRNQVAVRRGPVVYCLESPDVEKGKRIFDYTIPYDVHFEPKETRIAGATMVVLEGELLSSKPEQWDNTLYREISLEKPKKTKIKLIPYYAWDNRGKSEMTVWIPYAE